MLRDRSKSTNSFENNFLLFQIFLTKQKMSFCLTRLPTLYICIKLLISNPFNPIFIRPKTLSPNPLSNTNFQTNHADSATDFRKIRPKGCAQLGNQTKGTFRLSSPFPPPSFETLDKRTMIGVSRRRSADFGWCSFEIEKKHRKGSWSVEIAFWTHVKSGN